MPALTHPLYQLPCGVAAVVVLAVYANRIVTEWREFHPKESAAAEYPQAVLHDHTLVT